MNLDRLLDEIAKFESVAFEHRYPTLTDRKKVLVFAKDSCSDANIRHILGRSIDDLAKHPDRVRRAIGLAREHVETLRYNRRQE